MTFLSAVSDLRATPSEHCFLFFRFSFRLHVFAAASCLALPVGAHGILGSSSDRSALILLLSDDGRHCVRAGRLSTLPPLDRGRVRSESP